MSKKVPVGKNYKKKTSALLLLLISRFIDSVITDKFGKRQALASPCKRTESPVNIISSRYHIYYL